MSEIGDYWIIFSNNPICWHKTANFGIFLNKNIVLKRSISHYLYTDFCDFSAAFWSLGNISQKGQPTYH